MADPKHTVTPQTGPDAGKTREVDHEKGLIESIKGLIQNHAKGGAPGGTDSSGKSQSVDSAVDQMTQAVENAPGGSSYG